MQSNETGKTKSARKKIAIIVVICIIAFILAISFFTKPSKASLVVGSKIYYLAIADSDTAKEKGLGNKASMPRNTGMLFDYDAVGRQCFWMKDMQFPLDIIWTDADHKVTHIEKSLKPDTYPKQYCANARYVIELTAGQASAAGITTGQTLRF
jgi:uncharacterized membrane protein (UPF0127 family)